MKLWNWKKENETMKLKKLKQTLKRKKNMKLRKKGKNKLWNMNKLRLWNYGKKIKPELWKKKWNCELADCETMKKRKMKLQNYEKRKWNYETDNERINETMKLW